MQKLTIFHNFRDSQGKKSQPTIMSDLDVEYIQYIHTWGEGFTSRGGGLDTDKVRLKALDLPLLILTLFAAEKGRFISLVVTS